LQNFDEFAHMKRTRKWAFVAQEALRLAALGLSPYAIAKRLDLSPSTVTRWKHAGKLGQPKGKRAKRGKAPTDPAKWAAEVRQAYALDVTDDELVTLGERALVASYDPLVPLSTQLAAMGRFQAIAKQLNLVARSAEQAPPAEPEKKVEPPRRMVRAGGVDPRNVLQAVK
jgi:hypothetical protein